MFTGDLQQLAQKLSRHGEKEVRELAQGVLTLILVHRHTLATAQKSAEEAKKYKRQAKDAKK